MRLVKLAVENWRIHQSLAVTVAPGVTAITGPNGSGKTSLLEAIYLSLQGGSFRGGDADLLHHTAPWWRVETSYDNDSRRTVTFDPTRRSGRKRFTVADRTMARLPPRYRYPVVLFDPDDLRLLQGSPARRRRFIDQCISQYDPNYGPVLHKYERALRQRNLLLKRPHVSADELFVWNIALSEYGATIIDRRIACLERINHAIQDQYMAIAHRPDSVTVHYSDTKIGSLADKLLHDLEAAAPRDRLLGYTSVGPHRHDMVVYFNNHPAVTVASRGEVRSVVLALKFIEVEIIKQVTGDNPIVLLDDVFSELDTDRQATLLATHRANQIILTTTHLTGVGAAPAAEVALPAPPSMR